MPELPEVETVRRQLRRNLAGKTISDAHVYNQKTVGNNRQFVRRLKGKTVVDIERIGKLMIFSFADQSDLFLLAHLKMTGQFILRDVNGLQGGGHSMTMADWQQLPGRHTRVDFTFTDGTKLYFNDMRLFGYLKLADSALAATARAGFGPEYIDPQFDDAWFASKLKKRSTSIKAALLDQSLAAGLGNIYVDEALFRAAIRPLRRANSLTKREAAALRAAARDVMQESIKVGGTTFQHFADTDGQSGNFSKYLQVFGKQGTACPRCGAIIQKIRVVGRGTHYCRGCQR